MKITNWLLSYSTRRVPGSNCQKIRFYLAFHRTLHVGHPPNVRFPTLQWYHSMISQLFQVSEFTKMSVFSRCNGIIPPWFFLPGSLRGLQVSHQFISGTDGPDFIGLSTRWLWIEMGSKIDVDRFVCVEIRDLFIPSPRSSMNVTRSYLP